MNLTRIRYKLVAVKSVTPSKELAKEHCKVLFSSYSNDLRIHIDVDLAARPFYPGLVDYITSGTPVV